MHPKGLCVWTGIKTDKRHLSLPDLRVSDTFCVLAPSLDLEPLLAVCCHTVTLFMSLM